MNGLRATHHAWRGYTSYCSPTSFVVKVIFYFLSLSFSLRYHLSLSLCVSRSPRSTSPRIYWRNNIVLYSVVAFSNVCDINNLHDWREIFADERVSASPLLRSIKVNITFSPPAARLWSRLNRARPVPTGLHDDGVAGCFGQFSSRRSGGGNVSQLLKSHRDCDF